MRKKIVYVESKYLIAVFVIFFICAGIYYLSQEDQWQAAENIDIANCSCPINFGKPECIDNKQYVPFYNANSFEVDRVKLVAKKINGYDIYNVDKPLKPNQTETLELFKCYNTDGMNISWCCGKTCCEAPITAYSKDVTLVS